MGLRPFQAIKVRCSSFHHKLGNITGVTVKNRCQEMMGINLESLESNCPYVLQ